MSRTRDFGQMSIQDVFQILQLPHVDVSYYLVTFYARAVVVIRPDVVAGITLYLYETNIQEEESVF